MTIKPSVLLFLIPLLIVASTGTHAGSPAPKASQTVFITAPSPCHVVDRVQNRKIYLKTATKQCIRMAGRVKITLPRDIASVDIYVDEIFWQRQKVQSFNQGDLRTLMKNSDAMKNIAGVEANRFTEEGERRAGALNRFFQSEVYQARLKQETDRIKQEVFNLPVAPATPDEGSGGARVLSSQERLYLFISSAMPISTLRNYVGDIDRIGKANVTLVLRGFIHGMKQAGPTLQFVSEMMVKDPGCRVKEAQCPAREINLIIDPLLFRKYRITQVPALVYVPTQTRQDPEASEGLGEAALHYTLFGDASLEYLLDTLHRETQAGSIEHLLTAFTKEIGNP